MLNWHDACEVSDLQPDSGVCVWLESRQIALFHFSATGAIYAVANRDPVSGANVMSRGMIGDLNGEPMIAAPMYKQHYSLVTGICLDDAHLSIKTYAAKIAQNRVLVAIEHA